MARSVEALAPFTIVVLRCGERYLLLHRAASKRLSPSKWTGVRPGVGSFLRLDPIAL
jgi:isopentenyldiphosphate isomerase